MTSIPAAALPVTQFTAFKKFVEAVAPAGWAIEKVPPWTFAYAAKAATSVLYAIGRPSGIAGLLEEEALAQWLEMFGTEQWRAAYTRALNLLRAPAEDSASFALDDPVWGWDRGAWAPNPDDVMQLNAWCQHALSEFHAAIERRDYPPVAEEAAPSADVVNETPTPEEQPPAPGEKPPPKPYPEAIKELYDLGIRVGRGGLPQNDYCQRVVDLCGVARDTSGYSDVTILRHARGVQKSRSGA